MTGSTLQIFMQRLVEAPSTSDLVELRVDSIQSQITPDDVSEICARVTRPSIFTFRAREEGGMSPMSDEERVEILGHALTLDFTYVDIEYATTLRHTFARQTDTKLILSSHDFEQTPTHEQLSERIHLMGASPLRPDIIKIATMVQSDGDMRTLLTLQSSHYARSSLDYQLLLIGMGERGRLIRILSPLLGAPFTFASSEVGESAPGQIDVGTMREIYSTMEMACK